MWNWFYWCLPSIGDSLRGRTLERERREREEWGFPDLVYVNWRFQLSTKLVWKFERRTLRVILQRSHAKNPHLVH